MFNIVNKNNSKRNIAVNSGYCLLWFIYKYFHSEMKKYDITFYKENY